MNLDLGLLHYAIMVQKVQKKKKKKKKKEKKREINLIQRLRLKVNFLTFNLNY